MLVSRHVSIGSMPSGTLFKQHLNLQFVLCLCFCYGRLPIQQLEHQLQALSLILSDHLCTLCQDSVLEGGDEDLSHKYHEQDDDDVYMK